MEYYDGNKVTKEINPVMRDVNWFIFYIIMLVCVLTIALWNDHLCVFNMLLQFNDIIYRCEMLHYQIFHPLNQAELPAMLDKYRIGGRPLDFDDDSSQSVNF
jgi:hypothetical protein